MDEVFSYASANRLEGTSFEFLGNEWLDGQVFVDYVTVDSQNKFDYSIPYNNQISDVHPPIYYFFIHTSSSMISEKFSYWAGIVWNIIFLWVVRL